MVDLAFPGLFVLWDVKSLTRGKMGSKEKGFRKEIFRSKF